MGYTQIHNYIISTNINQAFQILQMSIQHLFQAKKKYYVRLTGFLTYLHQK